MASDIVLNAIQKELDNARRVFPTPLRSPHEAYAVILEELDEAWDEVKANRSGAFADEILQTAAMCVRAIEDLGLAWKVK